MPLCRLRHPARIHPRWVLWRLRNFDAHGTETDSNQLAISLVVSNTGRSGGFASCQPWKYGIPSSDVRRNPGHRCWT